MDEIKKIKEIKNTVKIVNIGIIAFLGSIAFFSFIISPSKSAIQTSIGLIIFAIILQIINMTMYMTIKLYYKISYSKIDINLLNQEYEREIEGMPPPAVASYLYNRNIEVFRDYTATILNLYVQKYIRKSKALTLFFSGHSTPCIQSLTEDNFQYQSDRVVLSLFFQPWLLYTQHTRKKHSP